MVVPVLDNSISPNGWHCLSIDLSKVRINSYTCGQYGFSMAQAGLRTIPMSIPFLCPSHSHVHYFPYQIELVTGHLGTVHSPMIFNFGLWTSWNGSQSRDLGRSLDILKRFTVPWSWMVSGHLETVHSPMILDGPWTPWNSLQSHKVMLTPSCMVTGQLQTAYRQSQDTLFQCLSIDVAWTYTEWATDPWNCAQNH